MNSQESIMLARSLFHLVPFTTQLLEGQTPTHQLPHPHFANAHLSIKQQIAQEALEALQDLIPQAIFKFLSPLGASQTRYGDPRREIVSSGRMWEQPAWNQLSLKFSDQSIDLVILIYQLAYPKSPRSISSILKKLSSLDLTQDGDLLFHFLCYLKLSLLSPNQCQFLSHQAQQTFLLNPLCQIMNFGITLSSQYKNQTLNPYKIIEFRGEWLLKSSLITLWPWLSLYIAQTWLNIECLRWNKLASGLVASHLNPHELFIHVSKAQRSVFDQLFELAEKQIRFDLLIPMIHYYQRLFTEITKINHCQPIERINTIFQDVRLVERYEQLQDYITILKYAHRLSKNALKINRMHPADREWSEKLFLSVYQAIDFEASIESLHQLSMTLDPEVG